MEWTEECAEDEKKDIACLKYLAAEQKEQKIEEQKTVRSWQQQHMASMMSSRTVEEKVGGQ